MSARIRLFDRPFSAPVITPPDLSLSGDFPAYTPQAAYSGFLTINNSVGKCKVSLVSGELPPNARLFVDNVTKRVYIKWDAYTGPGTTSQFPNGSFEDGADGWTLGTGWEVGSVAREGTHGLTFLGLTGTSECEGPKIFLHDNAAPVAASCQVQQGASSKHNVGAKIFIRWFAGDVVLSTVFGNLVDSGSGGAWNLSSVSGFPPPLATHIAAGVQGKRALENKALYVDQFIWDVDWVTGEENIPTYTITVAVTDGLNRTAYWTGTIEPYIYVRPTSLLLYSVSSTSYTSVTNTGLFPSGSTIGVAIALGGIVAVGNKLMCVSSGNFRVSSDYGATWSMAAGVPASTYSNIAAVGTTVLVPGTSGVQKSTDYGATWSNSGGRIGDQRLYVSGLRVLGVSYSNTPCISPDAGGTWGAAGARWDTGTYSFSLGSGRVACGLPGGEFVIVGDMWGGPYGHSYYVPGIAVTSASGTDTSITAYPIDSGLNVKAHSVVYTAIDGGRLFAGLGNGAIYTAASPSGPWSVRSTLPVAGIVTCLYYDGNELFATLSSGQLYKSSDAGVSWSSVTVPSSGLATTMISL